jgi:hypothetical protein
MCVDLVLEEKVARFVQRVDLVEIGCDGGCWYLAVVSFACSIYRLGR